MKSSLYTNAGISIIWNGGRLNLLGLFAQLTLNNCCRLDGNLGLCHEDIRVMNRVSSFTNK